MNDELPQKKIEEIKGIVDAAANEPQARLVIELMPNGSVNINGPIQNKILCYGLLECGKDAIREFVAKNQGNQIVVPFPKMRQQ